MGAALHFDSWVPNFGLQEYMRHTAETDAVFPHAYRFERGFLHPGDAPGHGVDIDEREFPTRLGGSREEARALLRRTGALLGGGPDGPAPTSPD